MIASSWVALSYANVPAAQAAQQMNCSVGTALKRLDQARRRQQQAMTAEQEAAVSLLTHSGCEKPVNDYGNQMSRQRWTDVVLGLTQAS